VDQNEKRTDWEHAQAIRAAFDALSDAMAKATDAGLVVTFPAGTFNGIANPVLGRETITRLSFKLEISRTHTTHY
jgi:hypothetical protein